MRVACGAASPRRLDQHAHRGLGPRCRELHGSCDGRAAEKGQVDQGARAQRPLSSFVGSFSPLIIRSSFLTSPPALKKGALNGCALRGACRLAHREKRFNLLFWAILGQGARKSCSSPPAAPPLGRTREVNTTSSRLAYFLA